MNTFITALTLSAPLLLLIGLGYFLKRIKMISDNTSVELSKLVLNVLLPVNIFVSIYDSDFKTAFDLKLMGTIVGVNILCTVISIILVKLLSKDKKEISAMLQVWVRGNHTIFGLPLAISISGAVVGAPMAIGAGLLSAVFSVYAVYVFEHYQNTNASLFKQLFNVLKTPLTLSVILAIIFKLINITIPPITYTTLGYISKSLTGISLITIGASFNFTIDKKCIKLLIPSLIWKLVLMPVIGIICALALGYTGNELVIVFVLCAVPVAIACFPTANCYDTDLELTKAATVYSHVACAIIIPVILSVLMSFGLV